MYYLYVDGLIKKGAGKHLQQDDLWDVARQDEAARVFRHYHNKLQETVDPIAAPQVRSSMAKVLLKHVAC